MSTTSTAVGRRIENFLSSCNGGSGPGDGVVCRLIVGDGVVSSGWYVLGCSRSISGGVSISSGVLAL
jgi:hypothetical protein